MAIPDPDRPGAAAARLVAEPEAVAATTLALAPREADPPSLGLANPTLLVGRQGATNGSTFAQNLAVWGAQAVRDGVADERELQALAEDLATVAGGGRVATITWELRQLAYRRA
jgi:hypothetical protein